MIGLLSKTRTLSYYMNGNVMPFGLHCKGSKFCGNDNYFAAHFKYLHKIIPTNHHGQSGLSMKELKLNFYTISIQRS